MIYNFITVLTVALSLAYFFYSCRNDTILNPVTYVIFFQLIEFTGTLGYMNYSQVADIVYYYLHIAGIVSIIVGFIVGDNLFPVRNSKVLKWVKEEYYVEKGIVYNKLIYMLILISTLVCAIYYTTIGYNVFLLGAASLLSGSGPLENVSSLRLATYNSAVTGNYYFPGYVNQFKNTLLPFSLFYLWGVLGIEGFTKNKLFTKTLLTIFSIFALIFILGTGQRGAFILAMLNGGIFIISISSKERKRKIMIIGGAILFFFFTVNSLINGRTQSGEFSLLEGLEQLWSRVTSENQSSAIIGFRGIIYISPTQWGEEWIDELLGILPSYPGSTLSNDIAQLIWGGLGTCPESSWGNLYYNFGWIGIIVVPFTVSVALKYFYFRFYEKKKSLFRIIIYSWAFFQIGSWVVSGPIDYYFNGGLVAIVILKILLGMSEKILGRKTKIVQVK